MEQFITVKTQNNICTLTLNRPPVNILNISMLAQIETALNQISWDADVRALVLQAEGKLFSAGVDVADHTTDRVGEMIPLFDRVCLALAEFPVPTIASVHGHALGGGCELVLCCDLAVLAENAKLGQPEIQLAAIAPIAVLRLIYFVGYRAAADLIFTGRSLNAQEALEMGLVNAVVPADQLSSWTQEKATQIAGLSRAAMVLVKKALLKGYGDWANTLPELEYLYLDALMITSDAHEGLAAFLEKRKPDWKHK